LALLSLLLTNPNFLTATLMPIRFGLRKELISAV